MTRWSILSRSLSPSLNWPLPKVNTDVLCFASPSSMLARSGVKIIEDCPVKEILTEKQRAGQYDRVTSAVTSQGKIACHTFINCTGMVICPAILRRGQQWQRTSPFSVGSRTRLSVITRCPYSDSSLRIHMSEDQTDTEPSQHHSYRSQSRRALLHPTVGRSQRFARRFSPTIETDLSQRCSQYVQLFSPTG